MANAAIGPDGRTKMREAETLNEKAGTCAREHRRTAQSVHGRVLGGYEIVMWRRTGVEWNAEATKRTRVPITANTCLLRLPQVKRHELRSTIGQPDAVFGCACSWMRCMQAVSLWSGESSAGHIDI